MGMNHLAIQIVASPDEAPKYKEEGGWNAANLNKAIVVKNGTVGGNSTIDLQFQDEKGNKFVAMITAKLLKSLAGAI